MKLGIGFPVALALSLLAASAAAEENQVDDDEADSHVEAPNPGLDFEVSRTGPLAGNGVMIGGYVGVHARLGERVAFGFGIDQSIGGDRSGLRRYDVAWNLPKLYVYLNPQSSTQLYVTTGLDMRVSHFEGSDDVVLPAGSPWGFFYFGSYFGGGIEHAVDRSLALRVEARVFTRNRTGDASMLDGELERQTRSTKGIVLSVGIMY
jgi:hypothetical protein